MRSLRSALRSLNLVKSGRRFLILVASLTTLRGIVIISQALLLVRIIVDAIGNDFSASEMTPEIILLALTLVARSLLGFAEERYVAMISQTIRSELRQSLLERIVQDDPTHKRERNAGETSLLITRGISELEPVLTRAVPHLFRVALTPLIITTLIAITDPRVGLLIFLTGLVSPVLILFLERSMLKNDRYSFQLPISTVAFALVAIALGNQLAAGSITSTTALLILILTPEIYLSIRNLNKDSHLMKRASKTSHSVLSILESPLTPIEIEDQEESLTSLGRIKEIRWTDGEVFHGEELSVTFRWGIASGGKMTLITGPTGSGKTTLVQSLIRIHTLSEGRIFIETNKGTFRIEELSVDYWLDQISWIPETPHFLEGTIEENLKLIKPRANRQRLSEVLARANLPVESLPNGLQTTIDQLDPLPLTGQFRRLALARAILKDAPIIICDSPNQPTDSSLELSIQATLKELSRDGKLVITVSNDEEVIAMADRRITLDSERIEPLRILESVR